MMVKWSYAGALKKQFARVVSTCPANNEIRTWHVGLVDGRGP